MINSVIPNKYLQTNLNRLISGPTVLLQAENVRIDGGRLKKRIGQELIEPEDPALITLSGIGPYADYKIAKIWWYNNRLWAYFIQPGEADCIGYFNPSDGQWYASVSPAPSPSGWYQSSFGPPQFTESNRRLFFAHQFGVACSPRLEEDEIVGNSFSTLQTILRPAGTPRALPIVNGSITDTTGGLEANWLPPGCKVAYRTVWKYTDANGTQVYGAVSDRLVVTNTDSSDRAIFISIRVPIEIQNANSESASRYSVEIFRTDETTTGINGIAPDPGDECYKVMEIRPTEGEIDSSLIIATDIVPALALQEPLYTNFTQDGIAQSRTRPPRCKTIADFGSCMFYGNVKNRWELPFQLIAVQDFNFNIQGLCDLDVIIVGDRAFQFRGTPPPVALAPYVYPQIENSLSGASESLNRIFATMRNLVASYNIDQSRERFDLDTVTSPDDFSGNMVLREFYNGDATDGFTPYIGLHRENGWDNPQGQNPSPIVPAPIVGFDGSNQLVGRGFKIDKISCLGTGQPIRFRINSAPDFNVGDTINLAKIAVYAFGGAPAGSGGDGILRFNPGQYEVSLISGNEIECSGLNGSSAFSVEIGVAPFLDPVYWGLLGALHCVKSKSIGLSSSAIGTQGEYRGRVYYSPIQEPESAPEPNYFDVGQTDSEIIKMARLNESLFVFKRDGLYRVRGQFPSFFVEQFDPNVILAGPDLVATMGGNLYALTNRGVYEINEASASRISFDIQNEIDIIVLNNQENLMRLGFAVGNEQDHSISFWCPSVTFDGRSKVVSDKCDFAFVYDGDGWTKRTDDAVSATSGVNTTDPEDKISLYTAKDLGSAWITKNRSAVDGTDYCDESIFVSFINIAVVNAATIDVQLLTDCAPAGLGASFASLLVGGVVVGDNIETRGSIEAAGYDSGTNTFRLQLSFPFGGDDAFQFGGTDVRVYLPYEAFWQFGIQDSDDPLARKHYSEVSILTQQPYFIDLTVGFSSDVNPALTELSGNVRGFQSVDYDPRRWPITLPVDTLLQEKTIKTVVATEHARCSQIRVSYRHSRAMEFISVYGYAIRSNAGGPTIERSNQ